MSAPPPPRALRALLPETQRAIAVRRVSYAGIDLTEELRTPTGTMRLRPVQSEALAAIRDARGGIFPIGVGHGKTLISALAGTVLGAQMTLLLTRPGIVPQARRDLGMLSAHWRIGAVQVWSYAALSRPEHTDSLTRLIETYGQGLVIVADECHELSNLNSARTRRVARLMAAHRVPFVGLSGTISDKSPEDFAHLAEWALRDDSPLPRVSEGRFLSHLDAWSQTTSSSGRPGPEHWTTVWPLVKAFGGADAAESSMAEGAERVEVVRRAFRSRLSSAPGVVMTTESSVAVPLRIEVRCPEIPADVRKLLVAVEETSTRPDGEELVDDLARATCRRQITAGYYLRWDWPDGVVDTAWMDARSAWARCVREELEHAVDGYDSPLLVWREVARQVAAGERGYIHRCWRAWDEQRHKPKPPTVVEWVSDYYLRIIADAIESEAQKGPTLIWYASSPVEAFLRLCGLDVYGAGVLPPEDGRDTIACGIRSHSTGRNLQRWARNLILEMPSSGKIAEQLLGRTHRAYQEASAVEVAVYAQGAFGGALEAALRGARYTEASFQTPQKLLLAEWSGDVPASVNVTGGE